MFPPIEVIAIAWSALSAVWFACAIVLVFREKAKVSTPLSSSTPSMSIFKPLPPTDEADVPEQLVQALESFIRQMDPRAEILLGVEEEEFHRWDETIARWQNQFPDSTLRVIRHPKPETFANPKMAWQIILARHATGKLWLWSDADIVAPENFLNSIRTELVHSECRALTCPYIVRTAPCVGGVLDALFVNIEFYPGVLLLRRSDVRFALGAATLFHAEDFKRHANWEDLGSTLADDNELGRQLAPVAISRITVETLPQEKNFRGAFLHYLRWHKTIRWCEPAGYAGQLILLPLLGWIACVALHPLSWVAWGGLITTGLFEVSVAALIFRRLKCALPPRHSWMILAWTVLRPAAWILSWTPASVRWNGCKNRWMGLKKLELFERT